MRILKPDITNSKCLNLLQGLRRFINHLMITSSRIIQKKIQRETDRKMAK
jgi:hypothetical protein